MIDHSIAKHLRQAGFRIRDEFEPSSTDIFLAIYRLRSLSGRSPHALGTKRRAEYYVGWLLEHVPEAKQDGLSESYMTETTAREWKELSLLVDSITARTPMPEKNWESTREGLLKRLRLVHTVCELVHLVEVVFPGSNLKAMDPWAMNTMKLHDAARTTAEMVKAAAILVGGSNLKLGTKASHQCCSVSLRGLNGSKGPQHRWAQMTSIRRIDEPSLRRRKGR